MSINTRSGLFAFLMVLATLQIPAGQASAGAGAEAPGNPAPAGSITGSIEARLQRISAALREQGLQGDMDATAPGQTCAWPPASSMVAVAAGVTAAMAALAMPIPITAVERASSMATAVSAMAASSMAAAFAMADL
jgi:hypothetical protein